MSNIIRPLFGDKSTKTPTEQPKTKPEQVDQQMFSWECLKAPMFISSIISPQEKMELIKLLNSLPQMVPLGYLVELQKQGVTLDQFLEQTIKQC